MKAITWIGVFVFCTVFTVSAATLRVPADHATIAAALAAAADGDTVVLARGTYYENGLTVGVGITLRGYGATIDGNVGGTDDFILAVTGDNVTIAGIRFQNGSNAQVDITGNNATVRRCTFRGGETCIMIVGDNATVHGNRISNADGGDFIDITGNQARILNNRIINGDGDIVVVGNDATVSRNIVDTIEDEGSIDITGDDAVVTLNRSYNLDAEAIDISGERALVHGNIIRNVYYEGIEISGNDAMVSNNRITGTSDYGIYISGNNASVSANRVMATEDEGIYISGNGATVTRNSIMDSRDDGIYVSGNDATVSSNNIRYVDGTGIYVSGDNYEIERNRVYGIADDDDGIYVSQSTLDASGGGTVSNNRLAYIVENGLDLSVYGASIERNIIRHSGSEGETSIDLDGDDNEIINCRVMDNEHHGFEIDGNNNVLRGCLALGSHKDGFHIASGSDSTLLDRCRAIDVGGEGVDNAVGATNTSVVNSFFRNNHLDIADGGSGIVDLSGTTYTTGGIGTPSEVN